MVASAPGALDAAELEHWFFGGWAVDRWIGRLTRPHDDIDVVVWRHDEAHVHEALQGAGWVHTPTPEDLVGTNYARDGYELQLTFAVGGPEGVESPPLRCRVLIARCLLGQSYAYRSSHCPRHSHTDGAACPFQRPRLVAAADER